MLAEFFETAMKIANMWRAANHPLAIELEHEAQCRVSGRMLRAKIQCPAIVAFALRIERKQIGGGGRERVGHKASDYSGMPISRNVAYI